MSDCSEIRLQGVPYVQYLLFHIYQTVKGVNIPLPLLKAYYSKKKK